MTEALRCPACGAELAADAPQGLCPKCLLLHGLPTAQPERPSYQGHFVAPEPGELAKLFPQLEIRQLLGRGGMGAVYIARQPNLDRLVALKILPPEAGGDPTFAERFAREARALAKLNHPHIVAVYDFGQMDGLYYFLMEYVDGLNLRELLRAGKLKPEEALKIVPQICEALQFAHDEGVVHRDIKPENILLDKRGRVKIADFGLAKLLQRAASEAADPSDPPKDRPFTLTSAGDVMGTPHYMAPEQLERPRQVDHRADIYSLGVVFYEMLTGELPLGRFAPPSQKVQIDVRLDDVVLRALENEPDRRYQHASEVKTDVEAVTRGPRTLQEALPAATPSLQSNDKHDAALLVQGPADGLILAGCAALLTALGVGAWLWLVWLQGNVGFLARNTKSDLVAMSVTNAVYALFMIMAGVLMRRLRVRLFTLACVAIVGIFLPGVVALNVAMEMKNMPTWPGAIPLWLGVPIAVWASAVLFRRDVRSAFQAPKHLAATSPSPVVIELQRTSTPPRAEPARRYQHASELKTDVESITPGDAPEIAPAEQARAPDAVMLRRLTWPTLILVTVAEAFLLILTGGYLSGAQWYFKRELPYDHLQFLFFLSAAMSIYFLALWWYLLAKRPQTSRSLQDFWRVVSTNDPRIRWTWKPLLIYLAVWSTITGVAMWRFSDAVQTIAHSSGLVLGPYFLMLILWRTYRGKR